MLIRKAAVRTLAFIEIKNWPKRKFYFNLKWTEIIFSTCWMLHVRATINEAITPHGESFFNWSSFIQRRRDSPFRHIWFSAASVSMTTPFVIHENVKSPQRALSILGTTMHLTLHWLMVEGYTVATAGLGHADSSSQTSGSADQSLDPYQWNDKHTGLIWSWVSSGSCSSRFPVQWSWPLWRRWPGFPPPAQKHPPWSHLLHKQKTGYKQRLQQCASSCFTWFLS